MTRTDVHSPVNLITENYEFVGCADNQPITVFDFEMLARYAEMVATSPLAERGLVQCHHCGSYLRYSAILRHTPTGEYIAVGETCLDNRFALATSTFQALRKASAVEAGKRKIRAEVSQRLTELPAQVAQVMDRDFDLSAIFAGDEWPTNVTADIRARFQKYGTITPAQIGLIERLISEAPAKQAAKAARDAEVKVPVVEGRYELAGTIVSRKLVEGDYGTSVKITTKVETPEGVYLVWSTLPAAICNAKIGDRIQMTASVTRSDRDESFGFGKRPSKASVLPSVEGETTSLG